MYNIGPDYLINKPLVTNNVFEHSRVNVYEPPKFDPNSNFLLLTPNYPVIPHSKNNRVCMIAPPHATKQCHESKLLAMPNSIF